MGAYKSIFSVNEKEVIRNVKPSNPEWVFKHAETVQVPFIEALRCWRRFVAMGCNKKGLLTRTSSVWKTDNVFALQILHVLPWSKKSTLSFQAYLKLVKWYSSLNRTLKLKVFFNILNDGNPIQQKLLYGLFKRLYFNKSDDEINQLVTTFITEANYKHQGFIDEEEFVKMAEHLNVDELDLILHFHIIPMDVIGR